MKLSITHHLLRKPNAPSIVVFTSFLPSKVSVGKVAIVHDTTKQRPIPVSESNSKAFGEILEISQNIQIRGVIEKRRQIFDCTCSHYGKLFFIHNITSLAINHHYSHITWFASENSGVCYRFELPLIIHTYNLASLQVLLMLGNLWANTCHQIPRSIQRRN